MVKKNPWLSIIIEKILIFIFECLKLAISWMLFLWRDHCAPWLLKKKVTIIIQQHTAGYKHCILCVTVWYGKPKLFSTIVHTNWFNDFARPPAHLKLHSGWLVPINVIITKKATISNDISKLLMKRAFNDFKKSLSSKVIENQN